jgi:low temperature requirement protein LtrA
MRPRSRSEVHRASTPLELFFDLVFVVAVALAAARLHHGVIENHVGGALLSYVMVFFAIWWAWMNFSWFASAYDTDDVPYRLLVMVQLVGALVLAAGVPSAVESQNWLLVTVGYSILRLALIAQWYRAWQCDPLRRKTIIRYMLGLVLTQLAWIGLLFAPVALKLPLFFALVLMELVVPVFAEMTGEQTPWHPEHIVERFGLFTIIVLGESILSASMAIQAAMNSGAMNADFMQLIAGGVLIVFATWWTYFEQTEHDIEASPSTALRWGYGHYFIYASIAAMGAGLAASVDFALGEAHASRELVNASVAVPVAICLLSIAVVHGRIKSAGVNALVLLLALVAIVASIWTGYSVLLTGLILSAFLAFRLWLSRAKNT